MDHPAGMICYACAGVGADDRLFAELKPYLPFPLETIKWIKPVEGETLTEFAQRLAPQLDVTRPFILLGVSFGSVVALELARIIRPRLTVIVSGVTKPAEVPFALKTVSALRGLGVVRVLIKLPRPLLKSGGRVVFGARRAKDACLLDMLQDSDPAFIQWALRALARWQGSADGAGTVVRVHGTRDRLISCLPRLICLLSGKGTW